VGLAVYLPETKEVLLEDIPRLFADRFQGDSILGHQILGGKAGVRGGGGFCGGASWCCCYWRYSRQAQSISYGIKDLDLESTSSSSESELEIIDKTTALHSESDDETDGNGWWGARQGWFPE